MPVQIDEKLFAHIHNDPFLLGSVDLQGNCFTTTIDYLKQYLSTLSSKTPLPKEADDLLIACQELSGITSTLYELYDLLELNDLLNLSNKKKHCEQVIKRYYNQSLCLK